MDRKTNNERTRPSLIVSAAFARDFPPPHGEEYAILGRSNVGKSSFINHVLGCRGLAHTSRTPGKTSLANFYGIGDNMVWVDLPGYGYARTSIGERQRWSELIRSYCEERENLYGAIWLIDIRHPGSEMDLQAREWLESIGLPFFTVLTKSDKLKRGAAIVQTRRAIKELRLTDEPLLYSVRKNECRTLFWKKFDIWRTALQER